MIRATKSTMNSYVESDTLKGKDLNECDESVIRKGIMISKFKQEIAYMNSHLLNQIEECMQEYAKEYYLRMDPRK